MVGSEHICGFSHENPTKVTEREIRDELKGAAIFLQDGTNSVVGDPLYASRSVPWILFGYTSSARNPGEMESEINRRFNEDIRASGKYFIHVMMYGSINSRNLKHFFIVVKTRFLGAR